MLASSTSVRFENRVLIHWINGSVGRLYIHEINPSAKKFLERSASRGFTPSGLVASIVIEVIGTSYDAVRLERVVAERVRLVAGLVEVAGVERVDVDSNVDPGVMSRRLAFNAAGFIATEHVRRVAGGRDLVVRDVHLERRHSGDRARGGTDLGREVRQRREVVAEGGGELGEAIADELHAVARVARKPDHHAAKRFHPTSRARF